MKLTTHLSTPWGWKAELALFADLQRTVYPYKWLPISCRTSESSPIRDRRSDDDDDYGVLVRDYCVKILARQGSSAEWAGVTSGSWRMARVASNESRLPGFLHPFGLWPTTFPTSLPVVSAVLCGSSDGKSVTSNTNDVWTCTTQVLEKPLRSCK